MRARRQVEPIRRWPDRRGDWTTVVLSGDGGFSGLCVTDASTGWFRKDMIGSAGVATGLDPVGARGLVAYRSRHRHHGGR